MISTRGKILLAIMAAALSGLLSLDAGLIRAHAQGPITYPELSTALQTKLPNQSFRTKDELISWLIIQIKRRKMDKPLTKDREDDLRQAGATDLMIQTVKANSPSLPVPTPTPGPVDLGDLNIRATNLVKPEYTEEARLARTSGEVKLSLELDEAGRVVNVARLSALPNGLTENAVEAARRSTFRPALRDGKPVRATGILKYSFKVNVVDVAATLTLANGLREKREYDDAIREYTRVLDADAKNGQALLGRGMCHLAKADYALAESDLKGAIGSDARNSDALVLLAIAQDFLGETRAAAENYGKALALRPELDNQSVFDCLYIDRRKMTLEQARSAAGAIINSCNQAFRAVSDNLAGILYYKRGIAYRLRGEYDKAIAEFESVRRANPKFAAVNTQLQIAYNSRGLEAFNKKDYKKAFDDVSLAIQAEPTNPTPYINRCAIYLYAWKQYEEAINDCSEAIKLATRSSMAYNHRGYAYEMSNSRSEAIADYRKALELDPQNQTARKNLNRIQSQPPSIKN